MTFLPRLVSIPLRIGELAFAAIVAGLVGHYLHSDHDDYKSIGARIIYTEVVAALSMLLALVWLTPFNASLAHYLLDLILFVAWIIAFALLVDFSRFKGDCGWYDRYLYPYTPYGRHPCGEWDATLAFAFLSAILWLISALVAMWFVHSARGRGAAPPVDGANSATPRRKWGRPSHV